MLIPHLHFDGTCREAISFYERAFDAKADSVIEGEDGRIIHAEMRIHGIKIFLNDRFGKKDTSTDIAIHLIVTFGNREDLIACHEKMKEGSVTVDPLRELPWTPLAVQFIDRFGVQWGLMVCEE